MFTTLSATSMPPTTSPTAVYCQSRKWQSSTQKKNWEPALHGAVRVVGPRHRDHAALMRLAVELGFDLIAGTAHAMRGPIRVLAVGIPALNHEFWNYPMECGAVVKAFLGQINEILGMPRCDVLKEFQHDVSDRLTFAGNGNGGPRLVRHLSHCSIPFV